MSNIILGSCSICGGRVIMPTVWYSVYPPEPRCEKCGAVENKERRIVDMKPVDYGQSGACKRSKIEHWIEDFARKLK